MGRDGGSMGIYLLVDGRRVPPDAVEKPWYRFPLRLPAREVRLVSGCARPCDLTGSKDDRTLGVLLRGLRWEQNGVVAEVPMDAAAFVDGFHKPEIHDPEHGPVRWTSGDAAIPRALMPRWRGEAALHLSLGEWDGSHHDAAARPEALLLRQFESLGEDCDFGLLQRHFLVEPPLSLFRWSGAPLPNLIEGLETGFAGLGVTAATDLVWNGHEYFVRTPYVIMHAGCNRRQDAAGEQALLRQGIGTLRILRRKLLKDIAAAERIFVFKSLGPDIGEDDMRRLHAALQLLGPAGLLCVVHASPDRPGGTVERLADGLYAGALTAFVGAEGPFDEWLAVCRATLALHRPSAAGV